MYQLDSDASGVFYTIQFKNKYNDEPNEGDEIDSNLDKAGLIYK